MNDKFGRFSQLPVVLQGCISKFLPTKESASLAVAGKAGFFALQQPHALPMPYRKVMHFLNKMIQGEHELVKRLLQEDIDLLHKREKVRDLSGREFDAISGFEYALWALDKHQWEDMLACLPKDEAGHLIKKGRDVATQMLEQYRQVKAQGVRYRLNGVSKTEPHYDFAIIVALQEQVTFQNAPGAKDLDAIDTQWRTKVGGAQRLLPGHVVDEYCSNTPFFPVPTFLSRPQPMNGLRRFYNWLSNPKPANGCLPRFYNWWYNISDRWESWSGVGSELGINFGLYKACTSAPGTAADGRCRFWVIGVGNRSFAAADLSAMTALCRRRMWDFNELEAQLVSLLDVEEQLQPGI